jgi:hypothetical protein
MRITLIWVLLLLSSSFHTRSTAGDFDYNERYPYYKDQNGKVKVFIEGIPLDWEYLTKNMSFVDFVRDPALSDVHVIIARRANGAGGNLYTMNFNNRKFENLGNYTLSCSTNPVNSKDEIRAVLVNTLKMGMMPFVNETNVSDNISIRYNDKKEAGHLPVSDPWRNWTFRGDVTGSLSLEKSRKSFDNSYNLRADKVTSELKFRNSARLSQRKREYLSGDDSYTSENSTFYGNSSIVKSISQRWSVGAFFGYYSSNYDNTIYSTSVRPAIEYNIFPWDISDRKVFTVAYYLGPEWKKYYQETIFGRMDDAYFEQNLRLNLQLVNVWGEIESSLNGTSMIEDWSKHRITFTTNLSVRLVKGLSVRLDLRAENIHDQIYLPRTEASLEDILMNKVQLPSTFALYSGIGLRLQFGSIYNNVVNNRL